MKKVIKSIALILSLSLIFFTFTGCDAIKDMREHQLFFTEEGSVLLNGVEYVRINYISTDESVEFSPETNYEERYYLTKKGVPVLLATTEGVGADISVDKNFLITDDETIYCVKEKLNYYLEILKEAFEPKGYYMDYIDFDYNTKRHNLTAKENDLIEQMLQSENVIWSDKMDEESAYVEELTSYGKEKLLTKGVGLFLKYKGVFYFWVYTDDESDEYIVKEVPLELYEFLNECN